MDKAKAFSPQGRAQDKYCQNLRSEEMEVAHCGGVLSASERVLKNPTDSEAERGVVSINTRSYWCGVCRKRLYYKQEVFEIGTGNWQRVKAKKIAAFAARLKFAPESDWVWGCHRETHAKIKVTVR